jgi:hypothetical protein
MSWSAAQGVCRDSTATQPEWLKAENWPLPKWLAPSQTAEKANQDRNERSYAAYVNSQMRARYVELESDFRSITANFPPADTPTALRIVDLLHCCRELLGQDQIHRMTALSTLDMIERYMVWMCPDHVLEPRAALARARLEVLKPEGWQVYVNLLSRPTHSVRAVLDESIAASNKHLLQQQISTSLNLQKLQNLFGWGLVFLVVLLVCAPWFVKPAATEAISAVAVSFLAALWRVPTQDPLMQIIAAWMNSLAMAIVGGTAGFLSGLLQARVSHVTIADYQEEILALRMKPLIGSLVAVILYMLISWEIISGVSVQNAGSYLLIAFLSGFSERYFLRLLRLPEDVAVPTKQTGVSDQTGGSSTPASTETQQRVTGPDVSSKEH